MKKIDIIVEYELSSANVGSKDIMFIKE